jgi:surfeit locus 1 family protein
LPLTFEIGRFRWSATWPMTLLTLAALLLFVRLGLWQWHRAQHKQELAADFGAGGQSVVDLGARAVSELPRYAQLRLQGSYDGEHQFLLDNMSHDGRPGYEVLTPLRLTDGRTVVVNRGWLPLTASRSQLPQVALDSPGPQAPVGRLDDLPVAGIALGHVPPAAAAPWPTCRGHSASRCKVASCCSIRISRSVICATGIRPALALRAICRTRSNGGRSGHWPWACTAT